MLHIAIIGAGVAGLAAAQALVAAGHRPVIFEKSRGVGGRVATRREAGCRFDHGAQVVRAPADPIAALVRRSAGPAGPAYNLGGEVWTFTADGAISPGDPALNAEPQWCWPDGLNGFAKALARGLDVRQGVTVGALEAVGRGYALADAAGSPLGAFDRVLLTAPAPQAAAILAASVIEPALRDTLVAELGKASYRRCISITMAYLRRPDVPWFALLNLDRQHPIAWLACEHRKHGHAPAEQGLITAQMGHAWSLARWEDLPKGSYGVTAPLPAPIAEADALAQSLLGDLGAPQWANAQRWRYALHDAGCDFDTLNGTGSGLFFAGDYTAGLARVHLAIESGWRAASLIAG